MWRVPFYMVACVGAMEALMLGTMRAAHDYLGATFPVEPVEGVMLVVGIASAIVGIVAGNGADTVATAEREARRKHELKLEESRVALEREKFAALEKMAEPMPVPPDLEPVGEKPRKRARE